MPYKFDPPPEPPSARRPSVPWILGFLAALAFLVWIVAGILARAR